MIDANKVSLKDNNSFVLLLRRAFVTGAMTLKVRKHNCPKAAQLNNEP